MTGLIGGSVVLIMASAFALVLGWANASAPLIWVSIVASGGAAVCLALAYSASKQMHEASAPRRRTAR